jgi:hypothetical protein
MNPASGAQGFANSLAATNTFIHFGLYVATLPSLTRVIGGTTGASNGNLAITSTGTLVVRNDTTVIGTSSVTLATGRWYWIGWRNASSVTGVLLQIDAVDQVSGTSAPNTLAIIGCVGTEASSIDIYMDDVIWDGAGFLNPSRVGLLVPISDNTVGTGWTLGTGTAISGNSGSTAVKNTPPIGVADLTAGSDTKQIRNASNNANVNYDANLTTYATAGIVSTDTVLAVQPVVVTAAPVSTQAKQGTVGVSSNPVITNVALGAGGTSGAFWSGSAGGTYATGWKVSFGTLTTSPSVTLSSSPVMRITQVSSSTRIAVVCFMGMQVAWTTGARGLIGQDLQLTIPTISQGVTRSATI